MSEQRKIIIRVNSGYVGAVSEYQMTVDADTTDDDITEMAWDVVAENIDWTWKEEGAANET